MQIRSFFVILFSLFSFIFSSAFAQIKTDTCLIERKNRPSIRYDFGISKLNSVTVLKRDSVCDVIIYDQNNQRTARFDILSTPILEWVFNDMIQELQYAQFSTSYDFLPFYYQIIYENQGEETLVESSYRCIIDNEDLRSNLDKLKTFLITLWAETLCIINESNEDNQKMLPSFR